MITRRTLLTGIAAGIASATAAATLIRARSLGWPFRKGLTTDDLPVPMYHAYPADHIHGVGGHLWEDTQLDLRYGGIAHLSFDADCQICRELAG